MTRPLLVLALCCALTGGCECPSGGAYVTITGLEAFAPSGYLLAVEQLRADPAPSCSDVATALAAGAPLPGTILESTEIDGERAAAGSLRITPDSGVESARGCPRGSVGGTFVALIYDLPVGCPAPECATPPPVAFACTENVSIPTDSTTRFSVAAVPVP